MTDQPYEPETDDEPAPDISEVVAAPQPAEAEDTGEEAE